MKALELADKLEQISPGYDFNKVYCEVAYMLRKQHEAIKVLRDDLTALLNDRDTQSIYDAKQTLADTEEFVK